MIKIEQYDNFARQAKRLGFELHSSGEYYYKEVKPYKDTYIYIDRQTHNLWVERYHEVLKGFDELLVLPKRIRHYIER